MKSESPIERQILDYLKLNPDAQDTLRGIVEWWLLKQTVQQTTAQVQAALASLVKAGKLSTHAGPDGRLHYQLSKRPPGERSENA